MTELKNPTAADAPRGPTAPDDGGADALASLHKMSTTAGISTQEYVAINIPSIVALFLGLAGVLAVLWPVLLLVPAAGIVVGLIALAQIRASNGTQTGRGFALLGILIALAIGGFVAVRSVIERNQSGVDRQEIIRQIEQLGRHVGAKEYDAAYAMMTDRFRSRVSRSEYEAVWEASQAYESLGRMKSMEWNRTDILFMDDPTTGVRIATAYGWVRFEKSDHLARHPLIFRKIDGRWQVDDVPQMFLIDKQQRRRTAAQQK